MSVIIPAYNEERFIAATLGALADVDYPRDKVDVLVVDNGSTDRTLEIARAHGVGVRVEPEATVGGLRNAGRAHTSGSVLAFLDADCVPARDWLRHAVDSLRVEPCVTGSRVAVPDRGAWVETAWFASPPQGRRTVPYINSGNLIVERRIFDAVGGFDPRLPSGEDSEFCRRASAIARIVSDDRIRAVHLGNPKTARQFIRREIWHGMGGAGAAALTWRNKPLMGAVMLLTLTAAQVAGLAALAAGRGPALLLWTTAAIVGLVVASAVHRSGTAGRPGLIARLSVLYYLYYLGRGLALVRLALRRGPFRRER